jgi:hypothetical protein
VAELTF